MKMLALNRYSLWGKVCYGLAKRFSCTIASFVVTVVFLSFPAGGWGQALVPNIASDTANGEYTEQSANTTPFTAQSPAAAPTTSPAASTAPISAESDQQSRDSGEKQTNRILWIIPNYRAVSASTKLPPLSTKSKFVLATQDSFDYSSFILAGLLAGYGQAANSSPEFHQEASGYGRYYWHSFADQAVGNYFTEAIVPAITREDPRYYTLGHGGFVRRAGYAMGRLFVTRTDSGGNSFNISEIAGNLAGAGVSNLYYPAQERTLSNTAQKWGTQIAVDGMANLLKEFWPDIRHDLLRK